MSSAGKISSRVSQNFLRAVEARTWGLAMTNVNLPRRKFLHLAAGAAALPVVSRIARAQTYPSRPVSIIVPFAAGAATDVAARIIGESTCRERSDSSSSLKMYLGLEVLLAQPV